MQNRSSLLFVIILFSLLAGALYWIALEEETQQAPETWSAFVYAHGYNSGRYKKTDDFEDYESCKAFATEQAKELGDVLWECGLRCRFDNSRQGFQCETMQNHQ
ncbi:hypothetical protein L1D32_16545 [Shewanella insulae]|uniref:Uncharacterized protein n=1 Tax=Shewanella insulae TaxID=2681496 RepID=A0A6L7HZX4_9GAMM|nr:hypothetical protein [Shewanella insulae]MCG9713058.1 hypothetical protein [Shewanella insulae]MCG9739775.1 hypothetical protein [Shewanella insulae]MCG9755725.1 hypothetical protein [Shewanella insulae]MXR69244.1 hypothetical protein [Shewanella insulae]